MYSIGVFTCMENGQENVLVFYYCDKKAVVLAGLCLEISRDQSIDFLIGYKSILLNFREFGIIVGDLYRS